MRNISSLKKLLWMGVAVGNLISWPALADTTGDWYGPYVGGFVGGSWSDFHNNPGTRGPSGTDASFIGGGDIGNNWQYDQLVLGAEGDFSSLDNRAWSGGTKFSEDWMSTIRGRAGMSFGRFLPYVTGGVAVTDTTAKIFGVGSAERLELGPALGAGLDTQVADHLFGRVEYLYTGVPRDTTTMGGTTLVGGSSNNTVRVGLNYQF